jgi:hypothetical protein
MKIEKRGGEDVELRKKEAENVFLSQSIRFRTPFYIFHSSFILLGLTCVIQCRRGKDVIS